MPLLRSVDLLHDEIPSDEQYPFCLPVIRAFETLHFSSPVTFFVGENGTGKSTLLAAIATAIGSIVVGQDKVDANPILAVSRSLSRCMRLSWSVRTRKGFYLQSEDFINYVRGLTQMRSEMEHELGRIDELYATRSQFAKNQARMAFVGSLHALRESYGEGLDKQSHGESLLGLFRSRFVPGGVYLLDEPEMPLSPMKQLSLISMIKDMESQGSQFIIATHSPILMAYPGAVILSFDHPPLRPVPYSDIEHVNLTRDFLNHPESFLRHL